MVAGVLSSIKSAVPPQAIVQDLRAGPGKRKGKRDEGASVVLAGVVLGDVGSGAHQHSRSIYAVLYMWVEDAHHAFASRSTPSLRLRFRVLAKAVSSVLLHGHCTFHSDSLLLINALKKNKPVQQAAQWNIRPIIARILQTCERRPMTFVKITRQFNWKAHILGKQATRQSIYRELAPSLVLIKKTARISPPFPP
ncbi:hypothetical protein BS78_08G054900 [Paspalum vaginatum]|nr:hypothetical protein BS78_08G054900 [Paspalum vaginatum]